MAEEDQVPQEELEDKGTYAKQHGMHNSCWRYLLLPAHIFLNSAQKNTIPAPTEIALSAALKAGQCAAPI